ncbi:MAG TPA: NUDIX hydrolase [Microthrixaceae bacterium]|jgi:8-oxo-dGTP pyrophosphatase MutT (NUDIX family)|nr:NUDIX hydrolase [Microthrixaceae bacterium]
MRWTVHGERPIYDSEWIRLVLTDVEIPAVGDHAARRFEHHVVRSRGPAAGAVIVDSVIPTVGGDEPVACVLLLWRHRFITDTWGWEIPGGGVDAGESSIDGACREALEESGWRVGGDAGTVEHLVDYFPMNGLGDNRFDLFLARGAVHEGDPSDPSESERVDWVPVTELRDHIAAGKVQDGLSLSALLWCVAFDLI